MVDLCTYKNSYGRCKDGWVRIRDCMEPSETVSDLCPVCEGVGIVHQGDGSMQTAINDVRCPKCKSTMTASACDVCGLMIGGGHGKH